MTLDAATTLTQQHQGIARPIQQYIQRLNASNTRAIVDLYTDDAALFQPEQAPAVGTQQLTVAYERGFAGIKCNFTNYIDEILTDGDLAAVRSHSSGNVTLLADGTVMPQACRSCGCSSARAATGKSRSTCSRRCTPSRQAADEAQDAARGARLP